MSRIIIRSPDIEYVSSRFNSTYVTIQIITNIWYVTHDPSFWKKPNEWKPERFLNPEGKLIQSSHESMKR